MEINTYTIEKEVKKMNEKIKKENEFKNKILDLLEKALNSLKVEDTENGNN